MIRMTVVSGAMAVLSSCVTQPDSDLHISLTYTDQVERYCGTPLVGHVLGCSRRDGDVCRIWARRPKSETDKLRFETIGHELMHCKEGQWHDQWGRMI